MGALVLRVLSKSACPSSNRRLHARIDDRDGTGAAEMQSAEEPHERPPACSKLHCNYCLVLQRESHPAKRSAFRNSFSVKVAVQETTWAADNTAYPQEPGRSDGRASGITMRAGLAAQARTRHNPMRLQRRADRRPRHEPQANTWRGRLAAYCGLR